MPIWLGTAIAETLCADFARAKSVTVASRGRVHQARSLTGDPVSDPAAAVALGRELPAEWIVTGTYLLVGDQIRVTPTIIETAVGNAVPAEKVDGHRADLFDLQDRVVAVLLHTLTIGLEQSDRPSIEPRKTRNLRAYEHYARGRQHMYRMDGTPMSVAIHHFEQAVSLDPDYALAHSELGTAHSLQFLRTSAPEDIRRAATELELATELDPELGEPYPWLANIRCRANDPAGAIDAGQKGVALQPDLP